MNYQYKRNRSGFWVSIHENVDSYSISTSEKYLKIINEFFPRLEWLSPTKWKESNNYAGVYNLWLPEGCYIPNEISRFMSWCDKVTGDMLWLELNKNIKGYFTDELDYCIACDFNFDVNGVNNDRTEIGEAEYQLKYRVSELTQSEVKQYADIIMSRMLGCFSYIPVQDRGNWCISSMPATENGKEKMAWQLSEGIAKYVGLEFIDATLKCEKPQMKQLAIHQKITAWDKLYNSGEIQLGHDIIGKNIVVVDDLYQSGATMWQYAKYLKMQGAKSVWGLVCVKSLKDSDNS